MKALLPGPGKEMPVGESAAVSSEFSEAELRGNGLRVPIASIPFS